MFKDFIRTLAEALRRNEGNFDNRFLYLTASLLKRKLKFVRLLEALHFR